MLYIFCTIQKIKIVLCCVVLCCVVSCHVMSCHVISFHVVLCCVVLCCVVLCYAMLCYVIYALLCYVDLFQLKAFPEGNSNVAEMVETNREKALGEKKTMLVNSIFLLCKKTFSIEEI